MSVNTSRPARHVAELEPSTRSASATDSAAAQAADEAETAADDLADASLVDGDGDSGDGDAAASSLSHALYGRRMRLSILSILSVPILFAIAPIELSMPFAVVALAAPLLTTCDCRRDSNKAQRSQHEHSTAAAAAADTDELHTPPLTHTYALPDKAATEHTTEASAERADADGHGYSAMEVQSQRQWQTQPRSTGEAVRLGQTAGRVADSGSSSSSSSTSIPKLHSSQPRPHPYAHHSDHTATTVADELSVVRSEERLVVRKERLITHKLVVRKVVSTEMVVMSVPVRRERLEVDTVQLDTPILLPDDSTDAQTALASTGYVTALPVHAKAGGGAEVGGKSFSGDRHNYAGVDAEGRSLIELLLCEERPRVSMEVVAVSRVTVTRAAYSSSQLLQADLRKEHIDYVAPHSTQASIVQYQQQKQQ